MGRFGRAVLLLLLLLEVGLLWAGDSLLPGWLPDPAEHSWLLWGVTALTLTGKADSLLILVLLLGGLLDRRAAQQALLALLLTLVVVGSLKLVVGRERPDFHDRLSFPSGDTAASAAAMTPFLLSGPRLGIIAIPWLAGVAGSRVLTNRHHPSDVGAGLLIGGLLGWLAARRKWFFPSILSPGQMLLVASAFPIGQALIWVLGGAEHFLRFYALFGLGLALMLLAAALQRFPDSARRLIHELERSRGAWLLAAVLAVLLMVAASSTLWDQDEARFALSVREMSGGGSWLVPTLLGNLRPDKPILVYWLMGSVSQLAGPQEWAMRAVSLGAGMLTLVLLWRQAERCFGRTEALLAVSMLAGSPLFAVAAGLATADALLLVLLVGVLGCLLAGGREIRATRQVALLGGLLGAALLTKGPPGLVIPLLAWLLARWLAGARQDSIPVLPLTLAGLLGIGLYLLWAIPADRISGGVLLSAFWGRHVWQRFLSPLEGHGGTSPAYWLYYLPVIFVGFFPWCHCLPAAAVELWKRRSSRPWNLLLGWSAGVLILFSAAATKLPHYVLPAFPALALAAAPLLAGEIQGAPLRFARAGKFLTAVIGGAGSLGIFLLPWLFPPLHDLRNPASGLALGLAVWSWLLVRPATQGAAAHLLRSVGGLLVVIYLVVLVVPALEAQKVGPRLARALNAAADGVAAVIDLDEPSLYFYARRPLTRINTPDALPTWLTGQERGFLLLPCSRSDQLSGYRWRELQRVEGFDFTRGRRQQACLGEISPRSP